MNSVVAMMVVANVASVACSGPYTPQGMYGRFYSLWVQETGYEQDCTPTAAVKEIAPEAAIEAKACLFRAFDAGSCAAAFVLEQFYRNGEQTLHIEKNEKKANDVRKLFKRSCPNGLRSNQ